MAFGGADVLKKQIKNYFNPSKDVVLERAQKVGDFSKINKEVGIVKAAGIMGYNAVLAEHKASGQKMVVIDSNKKAPITADDIKSPEVEEKLKAAINKYKYQAAAVEDFRVTEKGTMISYGQNVPYVKFTARIKKLPIGEISGIISVVKDSKGNDKILVSANEKDRYSQLIANEFFKEIK
jgi:hypothetical protein